MFIYRNFFAAIAAIAMSSGVFADNTTLQTAKGSETVKSSMKQQTTVATEVKINVNKAKAKDLLKVKGMNAAKARAIVYYRKKHGEFKSLADLVKVKSLSKLKPEELKEIQDQLTLN